MAQVSWVYVGDAGSPQRVGLYHGDSSGHLVIYCGQRIVQVDFSVKETTYYSFFIGDELCEVHLYREPDGRFTYEFKVNKEIDTPLNQERKKVERRTWRYLALFVGGAALLVSAFVGLGYWQNRRQADRLIQFSHKLPTLSSAQYTLLAQAGKNSSATFHIDSLRPGKSIRYSFVSEDRRLVNGELDIEKLAVAHAFDVREGDGFSARYWPESPQIHYIDFEYPDDATVLRIIQTALNTEIQLHPERSPQHCACMVQTLVETKGWRALSLLTRQAKSESDKNAYLRLIRDPEFQKTIDHQCWDQR